MGSITAASMKIWGDIAGYVAWEKVKIGLDMVSTLVCCVLDYIYSGNS